MRAWTVDADDIRVAEDFDDALLHHTPEIDSFLNLDRDDKFIVIGTKGFGKTLLLKAKRILYQRDGRAACLPTGNLLDKPIGDKVFSKEALAFFAASSLPWSKLWLTAIAAATLKHLRRADGLRVAAKLTGLMADERLHGVIDHFVRLLDFSPSELQRAAADTDGHLLPRLRAINSPVAIFIDGVDEYFNKHIESRASLPSVTGPLSPSVWYFAQLGLVEVAYQLRRINHHLKVFAAIRKEAYARLQTTVMSQQYRGSAVDIVYPIESLREIAREYLTEIAPYVGNLELERFLGRIPGHILTREEAEDLFRSHNAKGADGDERHVFCALYRVGLLGHLHHDWVRGDWVQRFLRPGEGTLEPDGVLPRATRYLVHPVLSDVIGRLNPGYLERIDRVDIVGYGRAWRGTASADRTVTTRALCVLTGDVKGFGGLIRAGVDAGVRQALEDALRKWARETIASELDAGDSVSVVHDDSRLLAQVARHLMDEVYRAPGQPRLRIALHYGEVQTRQRALDGTHLIAGGEAVLCAARVEPHVEPGQIWVTEEFRAQPAERPSLWRTTPLTWPGGAPEINVKKEGGTEPDLWVRLHRLEF